MEIEEMENASEEAKAAIDRSKALTFALLTTMLNFREQWEKEGVDARMSISMIMTAATMFVGDVMFAAVHDVDDHDPNRIDKLLDDGLERVARGAKDIALLNMKRLDTLADDEHESRH